MIDSASIVRQLIKEAKDKTLAKTAAVTCAKNCPPGKCECGKKEEKKDSTKEANLKTAALMREMASNIETILPQPVSAKLAKDLNFPVHPAPRPGFHLKPDDMGHTPFDPTKPKTKMPEKEFKTDEAQKPGASAPRQDSLTNNKSAAAVLDKLAADGVAYKTTKAGEPGSDFAGNSSDSAGFGNELRPHIRTAKGMIDATKRDLKRNYIKDQVGKLFKHVDPEKDTVIKQVFHHGAETSKLAGLEVLKKMKGLVNKEEKEEHEEEKVAPGIHAKIKKEEAKETATKKLASIVSNPNHPKYNAVMSVIKKAEGLPQSAGAAGAPVASPEQVPGQQDPTQAMKPPGCTCQQGMDGQPLCPICKIQEILKLQQMQQGQEGAANPMQGSQGAAAMPAGGAPNA